MTDAEDYTVLPARIAREDLVEAVPTSVADVDVVEQHQFFPVVTVGLAKRAHGDGEELATDPAEASGQ